MAGFAAFIDESGCDGFDFENGSSDFLVLGAVITRTSRLGQFDDAIDAIRAVMKKEPSYSPQSFKKLKSARSKRWAIASCFKEMRVQTVAVLIHKPSLEKEAWEQNKSDLYFYGSQFLAQRISWACRDAHAAQAEEDPRCRIVFCRRGHLRYEDFRDYIRKLRDRPDHYGVDVAWDHLDTELIIDEPHEDGRAAHIAADHFAAAIGLALEYKEYGQFDDGMARLWAERFYRHKKRVFSNGLKVWPNEAIELLRKDPRGAWIRVSFGW